MKAFDVTQVVRLLRIPREQRQRRRQQLLPGIAQPPGQAGERREPTRDPCERPALTDPAADPSSEASVTAPAATSTTFWPLTAGR